MNRKPRSDDTSADKDDFLTRARREFERCRDAWRENQEAAREDLRFARLGEQWPADIEQQRRREARPNCAWADTPTGACRRSRNCIR